MKKSSTVFVGNIEFDIPEEKIIKELSVIGRVVNFKLLYDRVTGKSKGYGFCEYESPLIAEMAIKSLKISFNGRPVKINYADNTITTKGRQDEIENIVRVINEMEEDNIEEVMIYLKKMAVDKPNEFKKLLIENNNLIVAIFQVFMNLNILTKAEVKDILKKSFSLDLHKSEILFRILEMDEEEILMWDDEVKEKIEKIRDILLKKKNFI
ncbi:Cleavage stimulation factor subunit 2 tau variant [Dictyocoela muelleri]|nr:Cleavage stimulation factor subunit 2 tau variant [Dictyocoela muelleri]